MSMVDALRRKHETVCVSSPMLDEQWEVLLTICNTGAKDVSCVVTVDYFDGERWQYGASHDVDISQGDRAERRCRFESKPEVVRVTVNGRVHEHDLTEEDRAATSR